MNILNYITMSISIICAFLIIRSSITLSRLEFARQVVTKYVQTIEYNKNMHYWNEMIMPYYKHTFNIFLWGKYSGIKKEYREILKPYFK